MTDHIIKWKNESDLSKGFLTDLDNVNAGQLFRCIYTEPHLLVNAFSDAFLLMGFSPEEVGELAKEMYKTTRDQVDQLLKRMLSIPHVQTPATTRPQ